MRHNLANKYRKLKDIIGELGPPLVAFSGGVDSALVLRATGEVFGRQALAVTASSALHPTFEREEARELANHLGMRLRVIEVNLLEDERIASNPADRCYFCKKALFARLISLAEEEGLAVALDGSNVDDASDYRPGAKALLELGVRSPLREAGLGKNEIRELSRDLGLPTWNKPAYACLATRIPYGERLTDARLRRIDAAEEIVRSIGVSQVRVRDHGKIARLEISPQEFIIILEEKKRNEALAKLRELGYDFVALDLAGYEMGSMNIMLGESACESE